MLIEAEEVTRVVLGKVMILQKREKDRSEHLERRGVAIELRNLLKELQITFEMTEFVLGLEEWNWLSSLFVSNFLRTSSPSCSGLEPADQVPEMLSTTLSTFNSSRDEFSLIFEYLLHSNLLSINPSILQKPLRLQRMSY